MDAKQVDSICQLTEVYVIHAHAVQALVKISHVRSCLLAAIETSIKQGSVPARGQERVDAKEFSLRRLSSRISLARFHAVSADPSWPAGYTYVCMYVLYTYTYIHTYACVCIYIYIYIYIYMTYLACSRYVCNVCIYSCVCVYVYVYKYVN